MSSRPMSVLIIKLNFFSSNVQVEATFSNIQDHSIFQFLSLVALSLLHLFNTIIIISFLTVADMEGLWCALFWGVHIAVGKDCDHKSQGTLYFRWCHFPFIVFIKGRCKDYCQSSSCKSIFKTIRWPKMMNVFCT